jgi:Family of unknown function (DUF6049)
VRPRQRPRPLRDVAATAVLAAALVMLSAIGLASPRPDAGVAGAQPGPEPGARIELIEQPTWVRRGERFDVRVRVADAPADAELRLVVHDALDSRGSFRRTLEGQLGDVAFEDDALPVTELPGGAGGSVTVGFATGSGGVNLPGRGVYPVEVVLLSAEGDPLDSFVTYLSFLTGATPDFPPLAVAVVVDVAAPPALQPDGTVAAPDGALARTRERAELLAETPQVPLTTAPRPETLEGLALAGDAGLAAVDALRAGIAGRPVLARPYVDVDLAALQRAGLIGEANAQADTGANVIRERLGVEPSGGTWLTDEALGDQSARLAVELGINRALVPASAVAGAGDEPPEVPEAPVRLGDDGPLAMVSDPALAAHLASDDGMVAAHRFVAELAIGWLEAPAIQRAVAVHIPADATIDPAVVSVALGALADGQAVRAVPLDELFRDVPPLDGRRGTVELADRDVRDDLTPITGPLRSARATVSGIGALVEDPLLAASLQRSLLLSTGSDTADAERALYVDRVSRALGDVSGAVVLPDEFRITLTSRSSSIPVTLTNLVEQDLAVQVLLESDQLEFPEGAVIPAVLQPGTTRLDVPVRVRTSGAFTLEVTVTSPDGSIVLDNSTFDVRSTAISGVGFLLSIGAGLFLAIWWARHWRSTRRSRHLVPASATPDDMHEGLPAQPRAAATDGDYRPAHMAGHRTRGG